MPLVRNVTMTPLSNEKVIISLLALQGKVAFRSGCDESYPVVRSRTERIVYLPLRIDFGYYNFR